MTKLRYELIPGEFLSSTARALTHGAEKHGADWTAPRNWSEDYGSLQRHLQAWFQGEHIDPESGQPHLGLAAARLSFLIMFENRGLGVNDLNGRAAYGHLGVPAGVQDTDGGLFDRAMAADMPATAARAQTPRMAGPADFDIASELANGEKLAYHFAAQEGIPINQWCARHAKPTSALPRDLNLKDRLALRRYLEFVNRPANETVSSGLQRARSVG